MNKVIDMGLYSYELPEERIAKYPLANRGDSKLLLYKDREITTSTFSEIEHHLPEGALLVFNNTKVISARLIFTKVSGAKIEVLCLEPSSPADYERMFSTTEPCRWHAMVGNAKRWKGETLTLTHEGLELSATLVERDGADAIVEFSWSDRDRSFGQVIDHFGNMPLPPYLNRKAEEQDRVRYQTVYSEHQGSVAAPTAGLHFTPEIIDHLMGRGFRCTNVTLHVGAGTFLPVKSSNAAEHVMHTEHFTLTIDAIRSIRESLGNIIAVGTTSVRTLESLMAFGYRALKGEAAIFDRVVGQWEIYDIPSDIDGAALMDALLQYLEHHKMERVDGRTQIMITPHYRFRVISGMVTNFHQPSSTLLLLISAVVGDRWRQIYSYALENGYRFLSYGDSSLLMVDNEK